MQLNRIIRRWRPSLWRYLHRRHTRRRRARLRARTFDSRRAGPIAAALAAATCTLLGALNGVPAVADERKTWQYDSAVLFYDEGDRVRDASFNFVTRRMFKEGRGLTLRLGVDSLTGASATGAVPALGAQTFTTPSGEDTYRTAAGQIPLDPTFLDSRMALSGTWTQPLGQRSELDLGASVSNESDYFHAGVNTLFRRDFNERNTSFIAGAAFAHDNIDPVGGAPVPLASMLPEGQSGNRMGSDSKTVIDLLLGVSQVLGPRTIAQVNYSFSNSSGYLADPYKLLSVVDPISGNPTPGPGSLFLYRFEARPDSRQKHSLFGQIKRRVGDDILNASYRFMTDDWGVDSHTIDLNYRWRLKRFYLQPHVRYYTQTAADFYRGVLLAGDPLPAVASADYRLSELDGLTYGLKFGWPTHRGREWSARVEFYDQSSKIPPETQVGALSGLYVDPTVDALIVQVGFRF